MDELTSVEAYLRYDNYPLYKRGKTFYNGNAARTKSSKMIWSNKRDKYNKIGCPVIIIIIIIFIDNETEVAYVSVYMIYMYIQKP